MCRCVNTSGDWENENLSGHKYQDIAARFVCFACHRMPGFSLSPHFDVCRSKSQEIGFGLALNSKSVEV